ncbi:NAD(P)-dependent dehydrogenase (short-subunit alcohol dehydrogenase family) [Breoghania corrubedonensis]|uniref:NAD(P)-dependent dehydrogenase (Short-subunit alcohol dehydrogenase family) n=1 Tax=Breoghania corrubedonensis TaxID=665038 RepID=A0A2T5V7J1_9HYPH|nr:SDR family oxidoreductase [Breoghania corrubedonensis]PTW59728.1 NAD(P)-dependent dehydrogenase (short-subunit alcohol dehydrogenase family) [Breoghania corrubedonensis]
MARLEGKIALVTGASSGIGETTARVFAREGATVVLVARREARLVKVRDEIAAAGGKADYVVADLTGPCACDRVIDTVIERFGRIDVLVNNAGIPDKHMPTTRTTDELWNQVVAVDLTSVFRLCRAALKHMEAQSSGSIINISSIGARGLAGAAYSSAKAGVIALTRNIAIQFAGKGIRCNATLPGPTPTELNTPEALATFDPQMPGITARHFDLSVPEATTGDQAAAILFFASDESKAITGQCLTVDHGATL